MSWLERELETSEVVLFLLALVVFGTFFAFNPTGQAIAKQILNQISIYAIPSVNVPISVFDKLHEPTKQIYGVTFYLWENNSIEPISVGIKEGTIYPVSPNQTITWSAGGYDCDGNLYYWERETEEIGQTAHPLQVRLYAVPECDKVLIKMFDDSYHDLSSYSLPTGRNQYNLELLLDIAQEYSALRREHICVAYDQSIVKRVRIGGLKEVSRLPTRLISGLDQCWYTGLDLYLYNESRKRFDITVDIIPGKSVSGMTMTFYLIDQDKFWKDGKYYFMNPITFENMGAGSPAGQAYCNGEYVTKARKTCEANMTISWEQEQPL